MKEENKGFKGPRGQGFEACGELSRVVNGSEYKTLELSEPGILEPYFCVKTPNFLSEPEEGLWPRRLSIP